MGEVGISIFSGNGLCMKIREGFSGVTKDTEGNRYVKMRIGK
jgi:hypothetical protein